MEGLTDVALTGRLAELLGLAFFLGLAFEGFYDGPRRLPGGVRTFPLLALGGGLLFLLDRTYLAAFVAGLGVLGVWLAVYYHARCRGGGDGADGAGEADGSLVVPVLNVHAYLLGASVLALPVWVGVVATVAAVLLMTGRDRLHALARAVPIHEIVIAVQFLVLTGVVLPLLPSHPVTELTSITPRQAWMALLAVCSVSYLTYLVQRIFAVKEGDLWMAVLGGLYSSTATTVVLARRAAADPDARAGALAGVTLASAVMYGRILVIVAVFNGALARQLAPALLTLAVVGAGVAALQYRGARRRAATPSAASAAATDSAARYAPHNPLDMATAALFAGFYVAISLLSTWIAHEFGRGGLYGLAAIVGISDIDPFVLNLAQGGSPLPMPTLGAAILIATASNSVLKVVYALAFSRPRRGRGAAGGWAAGGAVATVATLLLLAAAAIAIALWPSIEVMGST